MNGTNAIGIEAVTQHQGPIAERILLGRLSGLREGQLHFARRGTTVTVGAASASGLSAAIRVLDPRMYRRILLGGTLGAAESYMDGDWTADNLTAAIQVVLRNQTSLDALESGLARFGRFIANTHHVRRKNSREGSKRNIAAHYDLGNEFFQRMLDPTMTYSAGIFEEEGSSMEQASVNKLDRLCQKLALSSADHLLEIGTGWGSMALHAASNYGCRVTTTTISSEQFAFAKDRVSRAGLNDRVEVLLRDYRDLDGGFDKIVSVEMIEAVGAEHYDTFFRQCSDRLKPGGRLALQAIIMTDQCYEDARRNADFIKRYIFPGSCIPSITALVSSSTRASSLVLHDFDDITPHYARTLSEWRSSLGFHRDWVMSTYGETFWRMWEFYLAYCEAGFLERYIGSAQLLFEKPRYF